MKTVILYIWNTTNEPFGIFTTKDEADKAIAMAADNIKMSIESLKGDLYLYELPLNHLAEDYLANPNLPFELVAMIEKKH